MERRFTPRVPGHKLVSVEWSGERGAESSSTGTCMCGWTESGSSQKVVRGEYRFHLIQEDRKQKEFEARVRARSTSV